MIRKKPAAAKRSPDDLQPPPFATVKSNSLPDVTADAGKEEAIRVCVRMRPMFKKEADMGHLKAWRLEENTMELIIDPPRGAVDAPNTAGGKNKNPPGRLSDNLRRNYVFDRCFDADSENEKVYNYVARDVVLDAFKGINGCCLAYGQTGSGKTHTIMGNAEDPGILPRTLAEVFDVVADPSLLEADNAETSSEIEATGDEAANDEVEFLMKVSYVEIYMERVNDLLQDGPNGLKSPLENLEVKEDPVKGFFVVNLNEETVATMDDVMALLQKAEKKRHFARTNFNEVSSRSHTVFAVILESNRMLDDGTSISKKGELRLVDLAGTERAGKAAEGMGDKSKSIMEEGKAINKSLFVLSEVISRLSKRAQSGGKSTEKTKDDSLHIPWRDSKLTRILSNSLGGNCRASLVVTVHPSHLYLETSFSALRFAMKSKTIKKKIYTNFLSPEHSLIMQQKDLIHQLQEQLKNLALSQGVNVSIPGFGGADASAIAGVLSQGRQAPELAKDDEEIKQLKEALQLKVEKFQGLIMKAAMPPEFSMNRLPSLGPRKSVRPGNADRMSRFCTLGAGLLPHKNSRNIIEDTDAVEKPLARRMSMMRAIDYLQAITRVDDSELQDEDGEDSKLPPIDDDFESLSRVQSSEHISGPLSERGAESDDVVSGLRMKLHQERREKRELKEKINELKEQGRFANVMMRKLGLSILSTGITSYPVSDGKSSCLTLVPKTEATGLMRRIAWEVEDEAEMKPLAHAMLNRIVCRAMLRPLNPESRSNATDPGADDQMDLNALEESVSEIPELKIKKIKAKAPIGGKSAVKKLNLPQRKAGGSRSRSPSPMVERKSSAASSKEEPVRSLVSEDYVVSKKISDETKMTLVESLLTNLTPWEQHVLALLYEQLELRSSLSEIKKKFAAELRSLNMTIQHLSIEKMELSEHCDKLIAEIIQYKAETGGGAPDDNMVRFARLMQKLEELSVELAERNAAYKVLQEEYSYMMEKCGKQSEIIRVLIEENRALFISPSAVDALPMIAKCQDKEKQMLLRDVAVFQAKFGEMRLRMEECKVVDEDLRRLNSSLYTELVKASELIKDTRNQKKFVEFELRSERKMYQSKLEECMSDLATSEKQLEETKQELEEANRILTELAEREAYLVAEQNAFVASLPPARAQTIKNAVLKSMGTMSEGLKRELTFKSLASRKLSMRDVPRPAKTKTKKKKVSASPPPT